MKFPTPKEIDDVLAEMENQEPSEALPLNASAKDHMKFDICRFFVTYLRKKKITQRSLAKNLHIDEARMSDIVHYRIGRFTLDLLTDYFELLNPKAKFLVVKSSGSKSKVA